jgi:hypothetical protein
MNSWTEFHHYPLQKQIKTLYEEGTFVTAIRYYGYKVNLYLLGDSYVEVFVNHKLAEIERIDLLDAAHSRMKFYADQIKLPQEL